MRRDKLLNLDPELSLQKPRTTGAARGG
jgi:hypothetical protein